MWPRVYSEPSPHALWFASTFVQSSADTPADVNSSKNLSEGFRQHIDASNGPLGSNPYFEVLVFGRNLWPFQPSDPDFVIPGEIRSTHALFTQYYNFKHSGRALTWLWNYSKNELRTHYLQQEYLLMTSSYQMAVLLQYNAKDRISLNELIYSTGIPKRPMEPILTALVKAKVLLNGEPDQYELNLDFRSTKVSYLGTALYFRFKSFRFALILIFPLRKKLRGTLKR